MRPAVSCCLSAAGVRFLDTLSCQTGFRPHRCRPTASTTHTRACAADPGRVYTFRTYQTWTGWALSHPGDDGVRWPSPYPWPPPAALHRPVPTHPGTATQPGMWTCRGISKSFLVVAPCRSFPSPVAAMVGSATLFFPRASYPADQEPATHVAVKQVEHRPVATSSTNVEPPQRAHSSRATSCRNKGNPYLKRVLGEAAASAARTDTFLGERYRRLVKRRGKLKALVGVARSILVIVWHLLADPTARFHDLGVDFYTRTVNTQRRTRNLVHQLRGPRPPRHPHPRGLNTPHRQPAARPAGHPSVPTSARHRQSFSDQGRRYRCAARFPHPPFNPYVRFSRIRLTDDLLDMVTQPSGSGWCHAIGAGRAR